MRKPILPSNEMVRFSEYIAKPPEYKGLCYRLEGTDCFTIRESIHKHWTEKHISELTPYEYARSLEGIKEVPGPNSNPYILELQKVAAKFYGMFVGDDSMWAWCADFMEEVCAVTGYNYVKGSRAKNWARVGIGFYGKLDADVFIKTGDIVISKRRGGHHVTFFVEHKYNESRKEWGYKGFGGNQGNAVCEKWFPYKNVIGVRRLQKA